MTRKSSKPRSYSPLQEVELIEVTDPAAIATALGRIQEVDLAVTVPKVVELYLQLSRPVRLELLKSLAAELSLEKQCQLAEDLVSRLPPDALQFLGKLIRSRNGKR